MDVGRTVLGNDHSKLITETSHSEANWTTFTVALATSTKIGNIS
jgi:hypothetical protein